MPMPKVTRYVRDGEVDPGVREVAKAIKDAHAIYNVDWASYGLSVDTVVYEIEKLAYFVASSGFGIFVADPFRLEGGSGDYERGYGQGPFVLRKYMDVVEPTGAPEMSSPWEDWYVSQHPDRDQAEKKYRRMFEAQFDGELIAEALMFYDPSGAYGDELRKSEDPVAEARDLALKVASGVTPLGRKWLVAKMISAGVPAKTAKMRAYEVYEQGGNLYGWSQFQDRKDAVRDVLAKFDPGVSDEQVETVAKSPLPLSVIESTFSALSEGRAASRSRGGELTPTEPSDQTTESKGLGAGTWAVIAALGIGGVLYWQKRRSS